MAFRARKDSGACEKRPAGLNYSNVYTRFQCYVHRRHLGSSFDMPSFDMLCNGCLTVKQAIFHIISGRNDKPYFITKSRVQR